LSIWEEVAAALPEDVLDRAFDWIEKT